MASDDSQAAVLSRGLAVATPARVRVLLALLLAAVFLTLQLWTPTTPQDAASLAWERDGRLHVFFQPDCPHCHRAIEFLKAQPGIAFDLHDISTVAGEELLKAVVAELGIAETDLGVPLFVLGHRYMIGFDSPKTTGRELLALIAEPTATAVPDMKAHIRLPIFGEIDPAHYSLLGLTVVMALADGFNPCAMWVLVYLISLIAGLKEREKIWWLVGTFVLASGLRSTLLRSADIADRPSAGTVRENCRPRRRQSKDISADLAQLETTGSPCKFQHKPSRYVWWTVQNQFTFRRDILDQNLASRQRT